MIRAFALMAVAPILALSVPAPATAQDVTYDCVVTTSCDRLGCSEISLAAKATLSENDTSLILSGAFGNARAYHRQSAPDESGMVRFEGSGPARNTHVLWSNAVSPSETLNVYVPELNIEYSVLCAGATLQ